MWQDVSKNWSSTGPDSARCALQLFGPVVSGRRFKCQASSSFISFGSYRSAHLISCFNQI